VDYATEWLMWHRGTAASGISALFGQPQAGNLASSVGWNYRLPLQDPPGLGSVPLQRAYARFGYHEHAAIPADVSFLDEQIMHVVGNDVVA